MFGLFKKNRRRTRDIKDWELFLIYNTLEKLPQEFHFLKKQIEEELFVYATENSSSYDPDFIGFGYSSSAKKFENRKLADFEITNIKVHNTDNSSHWTYSIGVGSGVIAGYSLTGPIKPRDIDVFDVNVESFKKQYFENPDYDELKKIFTKEELELINKSEVYKVTLEDKIYFHIQDLEDGDFIGVDSDKVTYKITHDPYEIVPFPGSLEVAIKQIEQSR